jgi:hypothetical protein
MTERNRDETNEAKKNSWPFMVSRFWFIAISRPGCHPE